MIEAIQKVSSKLEGGSRAATTGIKGLMKVPLELVFSRQESTEKRTTRLTMEGNIYRVRLQMWTTLINALKKGLPEMGFVF
jgi:hypothetical protein